MSAVLPAFFQVSASRSLDWAPGMLVRPISLNLLPYWNDYCYDIFFPFLTRNEQAMAHVPNLFLYSLQTKNDLHTNKLFKKPKGRLILCDTLKLYTIQISESINKVY